MFDWSVTRQMKTEISETCVSWCVGLQDASVIATQDTARKLKSCPRASYAYTSESVYTSPSTLYCEIIRLLIYYDYLVDITPHSISSISYYLSQLRRTVIEASSLWVSWSSNKTLADTDRFCTAKTRYGRLATRPEKKKRRTQHQKKNYSIIRRGGAFMSTSCVCSVHIKSVLNTWK
jgi:hypothetical protein